MIILKGINQIFQKKYKMIIYNVNNYYSNNINEKEDDGAQEKFGEEEMEEKGEENTEDLQTLKDKIKY